jgi:hypothetical protein
MTAARTRLIIAIASEDADNSADRKYRPIFDHFRTNQSTFLQNPSYWIAQRSLRQGEVQPSPATYERYATSWKPFQKTKLG